VTSGEGERLSSDSFLTVSVDVPYGCGPAER